MQVPRCFSDIRMTIRIVDTHRNNQVSILVFGGRSHCFPHWFYNPPAPSSGVLELRWASPCSTYHFAFFFNTESSNPPLIKELSCQLTMVCYSMQPQQRPWMVKLRMCSRRAYWVEATTLGIAFQTAFYRICCIKLAHVFCQHCWAQKWA